MCHCATEGARLPTLRGGTRSGRAMHTLLRPLSRFYTVRSRGFPYPHCEFLDEPLCGAVCQSAHRAQPAAAMKPFGLKKPTKSQLAPVRAFRGFCAPVSSTGARLPSGRGLRCKPVQEMHQPVWALSFVQKKCSYHDRRRLHPSGERVQIWIMALCRSGSEFVKSVRTWGGSYTCKLPSPFEWLPTQ